VPEKGKIDNHARKTQPGADYLPRIISSILIFENATRKMAIIRT
jgi:hypothetical protein